MKFLFGREGGLIISPAAAAMATLFPPRSPGMKRRQTAGVEMRGESPQGDRGQALWSALPFLPPSSDLEKIRMTAYSVKIRLQGSISYVTVNANSAGHAKKLVMAQYGDSVDILSVTPARRPSTSSTSAFGKGLPPRGTRPLGSSIPKSAAAIDRDPCGARQRRAFMSRRGTVARGMKPSRGRGALFRPEHR